MIGYWIGRKHGRSTVDEMLDIARALSRIARRCEACGGVMQPATVDGSLYRCTQCGVKKDFTDYEGGAS